jgi:hypothetical protein
MKTSYKYLQLGLILLASATSALAQTSGSYNNQAPPMQGQYPQAEPVHPGSLNYVEGQVSADGQPLTSQSVGHFSLKPGQSLDTGNGYAEVLLTPGAFLRVGPNSELTLPAAGLSDTQIKLTRGNAMLEADQFITGTHLEVTLGTTSADVLKKGLYQFSTTPLDVRVFDGEANVIGLSKQRKIGRDDQILLASGDNLKKTGFDVKQAKSDPLYIWSEARSRDEANQNRLVAVNSTGYAPAGGGWFWDPYLDYYGFWPASAYLYSPFGFGFYGGYYPGFYGGYSGIYRHGYYPARGFVAGAHVYSGVHGNGVGSGFHGGGFGGGAHAGGGGGGRR